MSGSQTITRGEARDALIRAGLIELELHGPAALSLRAIARRAGVSHAAPKHHFDDRSGLLTALAARGFAEFRQALEAALTDAHGSAAEQLTTLGRAYLGFGLAQPQLFSLMFRGDELHASDPELTEHKRAAFDVLKRSIDAGRQSGSDAAAPSSETLALVSWAFIHGVVVLTFDGALASLAPDQDPLALATALASTFGDLVSGDQGPDAAHTR